MVLPALGLSCLQNACNVFNTLDAARPMDAEASISSNFKTDIRDSTSG